MKRRQFLGTAIATGLCGSDATFARQSANAAEPSGNGPRTSGTLGGMSLEALREDYRRRLFEQYLPFWEKGGYDRQYGGLMCEMNDDGSVADDQKYIWYQGRGLWVYAFLYNHFGKNQRWLDIATRTRDFMVRRMYAGEGKWVEKVHRDGTPLEGVGKNVYGWLFAAGGLAQLHIATGDQKDLQLAHESIAAAIEAYDDPNYDDAYSRQYAAVAVPERGLRSQGHSMVIIWVLSQLLSIGDNPQLMEVHRRHIGVIMNRFWNPDFGIANEFLQHDYSRLPGAEAHMYAGHSLETLWIVMHEALRIKDRLLFDTITARIRRLLEMCWDYVFEGWAGADFFVFGSPKHCQGPDYNMKTMWAQCEILIACTTILEHTGQPWAREWYDRTRAFALKTMPVPTHGVWRQAVDRRGNDVKRAGISTQRKDNFHQARMLMLNLLSLDRMIANRQSSGTPQPF
jgi:N-acylglucosamine 2-epimerase